MSLPALLWGLLLGPSPALAYDAHGFEQAPSDGDLDDMLTVWRPEAQEPGAIGLDGLFEYAEAPLVAFRNGPDGLQNQPLLDNLFGVNLGLHAAVHERLAFALSAPVFFTSRGPQGTGGPALGDARLYAPITLVPLADDADDGVGLSLIPFLDLPSGAQDRFLGDSGVGGGGLASFALRYKALLLAFNLGADAGGLTANDATNNDLLSNLQGGGRLTTALGASYRLSDTLAVRSELTLDPSLKANAVPMAESPGEWMVSLRGKPNAGLNWTAGAATATSRGASAAAFRAFAGVGWSWGKQGLRDTDGDGLIDRVDACPEQLETVNGYLDDDGCPDQLANVSFLVRDPNGRPMPGVPIVVGGKELGRTDAQGRFIWADQLPDSEVSAQVTPNRRTAMEPAEFGAFTLAPGSNQRELQLGWLPGAVKVVTRSQDAAIVDATVRFLGPLSHDPEALGDDGEGFFVLEPGDWTLLISADTFGIERRELTIKPNQRSLVVIEVTLAPAVVHTTREEVVILEQVKFAFDKSEVAADSFKLLDEVVNNLLQYDQITKVEVQGHTDSKGPARYNQRLSQARVDAVVAYMASKGLSPARLDAVGYGESCAIASNHTEQGRAANRRVQFVIIDPAPQDGVPCHDGIPARQVEGTTITVEDQ